MRSDDLVTPAEQRAAQIARLLLAADSVRVTKCNVWSRADLRYRLGGDVTIQFTGVEAAQQFEALVSRLRTEAA